MEIYVDAGDEHVLDAPVGTLALTHHVVFEKCFAEIAARTGIEISHWSTVTFSGEQLDALAESLVKLEAELRAQPVSWMVRVFETGEATWPEFAGVDGATEIPLRKAREAAGRFLRARGLSSTRAFAALVAIGAPR